MIGTLAVAGAAAQAAAHLDPADALDHPVEQDQVGLDLLGQDQRFLAVAGARHGIAGAVEVEGDQLGQRAVVLDQQEALRAHRHAASAESVAARAVGEMLAGGGVIDHLGDVGGMVADPLDVLGDEQQVRRLADVAADFPS